VRSALSKTPGVVSADVVLGKAVVQYDKSKTDVKKIIAAVDEAGYSAKEKKEKK
jgi:copper chaperone CopZ